MSLSLAPKQGRSNVNLHNVNVVPCVLFKNMPCMLVQTQCCTAWQLCLYWLANVTHLHRLPRYIDGQHITTGCAREQPCTILGEAEARDGPPHSACDDLITTHLHTTRLCHLTCVKYKWHGGCQPLPGLRLSSTERQRRQHAQHTNFCMQQV